MVPPPECCNTYELPSWGDVCLSHGSGWCVVTGCWALGQGHFIVVWGRRYECLLFQKLLWLLTVQRRRRCLPTMIEMLQERRNPRIFVFCDCGKPLSPSPGLIFFKLHIKLWTNDEVPYIFTTSSRVSPKCSTPLIFSLQHGFRTKLTLWRLTTHIGVVPHR